MSDTSPSSWTSRHARFSHQDSTRPIELASTSLPPSGLRFRHTCIQAPLVVDGWEMGKDPSFHADLHMLPLRTYVEVKFNVPPTHYRSYRGRVPNQQCQSMQITVMQQICSMRKHTIYTEINTNEWIHVTVRSEMKHWAQWNGPSVTKPNPENCKNCPCKCGCDCTTSVHSTTQNSYDNLPLYLQTTIWAIAQMLSIGADRKTCRRPYNLWSLNLNFD